MDYFDFHHHNVLNFHGIYNLTFGENIPKSFFSVGIHPNAIDGTATDKLIWLQELSTHPQCIAIGECGLDGLSKISIELQTEIFERQIELANRIRKPLIIHCVKRFSELIAFRNKAKVPMVVHGFNKRKTVGDILQKHDFYLSFGKSLLQNVNLQEFVRSFPVERLFLESDSATFDLAELYEKVSRLKGITQKQMILHIEENLTLIQHHIK